MNQWQRDMNTDIDAGRLRAIPGDEWDKLYWSGVVERHTAFERAAQKMADTFDIQTLENLFFASIYAKQGQARFDDYPLYRRALAIARERKEPPNVPCRR